LAPDIRDAGERDEEVSMNWSASRLTAFQALAE